MRQECGKEELEVESGNQDYPQSQQHCKNVGGSKMNSGVILWVGQPRQRAESKEPSQMSRVKGADSNESRQRI